MSSLPKIQYSIHGVYTGFWPTLVVNIQFHTALCKEAHLRQGSHTQHRKPYAQKPFWQEIKHKEAHLR